MGDYITIVSVDAPQSVPQGAPVNVAVNVKSLVSEGSIHVAVTGAYNSTTVTFVPEPAQVGPLQTQSFTTTFPMPSKGVSVIFGAWYWGTDGQWHLDDQGSVDIALAGEEPEPPDEEETKIPWPWIAGIAGIAALGFIWVRR